MRLRLTLDRDVRKKGCEYQICLELRKPLVEGSVWELLRGCERVVTRDMAGKIATAQVTGRSRRLLYDPRHVTGGRVAIGY